MRLTVLGKSPSWEDAGGACSRYLVERGETTMLIDCGNGALGKLRAIATTATSTRSCSRISMPTTSLDLIPFACALTYGPAAAEGLRTPRLIGPAGIEPYLARLGVAIGDPGLIVGAFAIEEYGPGVAVAVGELAVTAHEVVHIGPTHAIEVDGGRRAGSSSAPTAATGGTRGRRRRRGRPDRRGDAARAGSVPGGPHERRPRPAASPPRPA